MEALLCFIIQISIRLAFTILLTWFTFCVFIDEILDAIVRKINARRKRAEYHL